MESRRRDINGREVGEGGFDEFWTFTQSAVQRKTRENVNRPVTILPKQSRQRTTAIWDRGGGSKRHT